MVSLYTLHKTTQGTQLPFSRHGLTTISFIWIFSGPQQHEGTAEMVFFVQKRLKFDLVEKPDAHFLLNVHFLQHLHELIEGDRVVPVGVGLLDGSVCNAAELFV